MVWVAPPPPPTRIISFQQLCEQADQFWLRGLVTPWWYEFSNRRRFLQTNPPPAAMGTGT